MCLRVCSCPKKQIYLTVVFGVGTSQLQTAMASTLGMQALSGHVLNVEDDLVSA